MSITTKKKISETLPMDYSWFKDMLDAFKTQENAIEYVEVAEKLKGNRFCARRV